MERDSGPNQSGLIDLTFENFMKSYNHEETVLGSVPGHWGSQEDRDPETE